VAELDLLSRQFLPPPSVLIVLLSRPAARPSTLVGDAVVAPMRDATLSRGRRTGSGGWTNAGVAAGAATLYGSLAVSALAARLTVLDGWC